MSLYDHENPQHLDYRARARATGERITELLNVEDRTTGMSEALKAAAIHWRNKASAK